jgi:5-methylcytosine-specific restriction endonuclease McrA
MIIKANTLHIPLKDESVHCIVTSPRDEKGRFVKGFKYHPSTQFKKGEHWRPRKEHWDKDWLYQKYITEQMPAVEIAKQQKCSEVNILFWLRKHGISTRTVSEVRKIKHWGSFGERNPMYGVRGSLHPGWKGGLTPFRQMMYRTEAAKEWFKFLYVKFRRKCAICGSKEKLEAHHIFPVSKYPLLIFDKRNGIILCTKCHGKTKGKEWRYQNRFLKISSEVQLHPKTSLIGIQKEMPLIG